VGFTGAWGQEKEIQPISGKKHAYMGDPGRKRGLELGFDQGYWAAKTDQEEGLSPDLGRHSMYHSPKPMYRYEFGNRVMFYSGFRSGFLIGYRYGWRNVDVAYVVPRKDLADPDNPEGKSLEVKGKDTMAGMDAEMMGPGGPVNPRPAHSTKARGEQPAASAQVLNDAL
jgi:hypothetical protein